MSEDAAGEVVVEAPYRGKRAVDLAIFAAVALPSLLVGLVCAAAVRLTSRGPVFFRQERAGLGGQPFMVWKFRTMAHGNNPIFPEDCHITKVGGVLRRLSLDELPQLINVALGDMSIVGPRPTLVYQVERYNDFQKRRLAVRPGLTGLAQVSGRNSLSWGFRIEYDVRYVETQSARVDLSLVIRTLTAILSGEGVQGHPTDDPLSAVSPVALVVPMVGAEVVDLTNAVDAAVSVDLSDSVDLAAAKPALESLDPGHSTESFQIADDDAVVIDLRSIESLKERAGAVFESDLGSPMNGSDTEALTS